MKLRKNSNAKKKSLANPTHGFKANSEVQSQVGLYRILIWTDIRLIILPDTGYTAK